MARKKNLRPSDAELKTLNVLRGRGPCTVRDVQQAFSEAEPTGYTTALKLAATGGSLLDRIRRVVGVPRRPSFASRAASLDSTGLSGLAIVTAALFLVSVTTPDFASVAAASNDGQSSLDNTEAQPKQKQLGESGDLEDHGKQPADILLKNVSDKSTPLDAQSQALAGREDARARIGRLKSRIAKRGIQLGDSMTAPAIASRKPKQEGVALEVEFDAEDHLLAEPMLVRCSLANYGAKPITLSYGSRYEQQNTIFFDITGPDGKPVAWSSDLEIDSPGPQPLTIPPSQRYIECYNLVDHYTLTKAGQYKINVRYESDGKSFNPGTLKWRDDLWKGNLEHSLGAVTIVEPARPADKAALRAILARATHGADSPYHFIYLFNAESSDSFDPFLREHGKSRYSAYARYGNALAALHRVSSGTPSYAKAAIANLESINAAGYPRLFAEQRLFHLIQAHAAAESPPEEIAPLLRRFLSTYPHSPFVPTVCSTMKHEPAARLGGSGVVRSSSLCL